MNAQSMEDADRAAEKEAVRTTATLCVEGLARALRREHYERVTPCLPYTTTRLESLVPWDEETFVLRDGWRRRARLLIEAAKVGSDQ